MKTINTTLSEHFLNPIVNSYKDTKIVPNTRLRTFGD